MATAALQRRHRAGRYPPGIACASWCTAIAYIGEWL